MHGLSHIFLVANGANIIGARKPNLALVTIKDFVQAVRFIRAQLVFRCGIGRGSSHHVQTNEERKQQTQRPSNPQSQIAAPEFGL
jgi:hypothetical protein